MLNCTEKKGKKKATQYSQKKPPLHASMKDRRAKTESTRTGSSGSCILDTTHCNAFLKLF